MSAGTAQYTINGNLFVTGTISGTFVVNLFPYIDLTNRYLLYANGDISIDWEDAIINDNAGFQSIDYQNRLALDSNANYSINYNSRQLINVDGSTVSIDYHTQDLMTSSFISSLNWESGLLLGFGGNVSMNWFSSLLYDVSGLISIDYNNRQAFDSNSNTSIDYQVRNMFDSTGSMAINYDIRNLTDNAGNIAYDWGAGQINDVSTGLRSIRTIERILFASDGSTQVMDWSDPGSLVIRNTVMLQLSAGNSANASLNMISGSAPTLPNDGDMWYEGTSLKFRVGGTTKTFTLI